VQKSCVGNKNFQILFFFSKKKFFEKFLKNKLDNVVIYPKTAFFWYEGVGDQKKKFKNKSPLTPAPFWPFCYFYPLQRPFWMEIPSETRSFLYYIMTISEHFKRISLCICWLLRKNTKGNINILSKNQENRRLSMSSSFPFVLADCCENTQREILTFYPKIKKIAVWAFEHFEFISLCTGWLLRKSTKGNIIILSKNQENRRLSIPKFARTLGRSVKQYAKFAPKSARTLGGSVKQYAKFISKNHQNRKISPFLLMNPLRKWSKICVFS